MPASPVISIIVAITRDNAIGLGGDQLYYISSDLRRFRSITMGHPMVMGRRTFESFPRGPLPGRRNIVITSRPGYPSDGIELAPSLPDALALAATSPTGTEDIKSDSSEIVVIGGASVYRQALPLASRLYLTVIEVDRPDADTFFPPIDPSKWTIAEQSDPMIDPPTGLTYRYLTLTRR
ncbi:MAG: dihydrofolate reductase [Muribaculaceae bacterium]|nr:dihydrofolate reductase [Muribaculaceae bacterium]